MKLVSFDGGRLGAVENGRIYDISDLSSVPVGAWPPVNMVALIASFAKHRSEIERRIAEEPSIDMTTVRLETPIQWPNKVVAFPANYQAHIDEQKRAGVLISKFKADGQGFFLKANSSLSGPADPIVLPALPDRNIHHECELAVVIGKTGREISRAAALEHVFGYSCLLDIVVRGKEERVMRKSYDSFCPVGPWIITADQITDHSDIELELKVNAELRQHANTRDLIVDIPEMIHMASAVMTLYPGDIIATGTPSGVGPIKDGDTVSITIRDVGSMSLPVVGSTGGYHQVWDKSGQPSA